MVLALLGALSSAGSAAAADPTPLETQLAALKDQVSLLTAQQTLITTQQTQLTSQIAGQILLQSAQTQVETGVLDKAKALVLGKSGLEQAEAEAAFAQLKGIQTGLKSVAAEGNAGTLSVKKGTDGTLLFGSKKALLEQIDAFGKRFAARLATHGDKYVLASDDDQVAAARSQITLGRLAGQQENLRQAAERVKASAPTGIASVAGALAIVQGVPVLVEALSNAAKIARVNRDVSIFDASTEGKRLVDLLVEANALAAAPKPVTVVRLVASEAELLKEAKLTLAQWQALRNLRDQALSDQQQGQARFDKAAKSQSKEDKQWAPSAEDLETLKASIADAKTLLDSLSPESASDSFWGQVMGQVKAARLANSGRIALNVTAQTLQVLENRKWRSDKYQGAGEVQVEYRVIGADGKLLLAGVDLFVSPMLDMLEQPDFKPFSLPPIGRAE